LGIAEPADIDVNAIAQFCGATVLYGPLDGCAARIAGNGDRAIITIDSRSPLGRQRFSVGHELGHWMFDRGKISLFSCKESVFMKEWSKHNPETRANRYASDLLMPVSMFKPRAAALKQMTFDTVKTLAREFTTSLTATAIRLVEHGPFPAMLVCSDGDGVQWVARSDGTKKLWPQRPGEYTYAHDILNGSGNEAAGDVKASAWFDHWIAQCHYVHEHSIKAFGVYVLSLLWWRDETMLIELDEHEERAGR
jgi:hypothetical protein